MFGKLEAHVNASNTTLTRTELKVELIYSTGPCPENRVPRDQIHECILDRRNFPKDLVPCSSKLLHTNGPHTEPVHRLVCNLYVPSVLLWVPAELVIDVKYVNRLTDIYRVSEK